MKQKQPKDKQRSFEMNGGYYIDGVPYMDCKITGEPVRNVGTEATSVIGSRAVIARIHQMFPEQDKPKRAKTGRPSGWHFMKEFVDKRGNVYHKGVEQPELKGTLKPTEVVKKKKLSKKEKEEYQRLAAVEVSKIKKEMKNLRWKKDKKLAMQKIKNYNRILKGKFTETLVTKLFN